MSGRATHSRNSDEMTSVTMRTLQALTREANSTDGIIENYTASKNHTVKCSSCKKRFTEDDIDEGLFIPEFEVCDPCLEEGGLV